MIIFSDLNDGLVVVDANHMREMDLNIAAMMTSEFDDDDVEVDHCNGYRSSLKNLNETS